MGVLPQVGRMCWVAVRLEQPGPEPICLQPVSHSRITDVSAGKNQPGDGQAESSVNTKQHPEGLQDFWVGLEFCLLVVTYKST